MQSELAASVEPPGDAEATNFGRHTVLTEEAKTGADIMTRGLTGNTESDLAPEFAEPPASEVIDRSSEALPRPSRSSSRGSFASSFSLHEPASSRDASSLSTDTPFTQPAPIASADIDAQGTDEIELQYAPSFHDFIQARPDPSSSSSPPQSSSRALSPRSNHSAHSQSSKNLGLFRAQSPASTTSKETSPLPDRSADSEGIASSDNSSRKSMHSISSLGVRPSPLDNLDRLIVNQSPTTHASKATARLPLRIGLLSFNDQEEFDDTDIGTTNGYTARTKYSASASNGGVRRHEDRTRKLETENMELRLKLQQYREMNASEQEITRVKTQIDRAERRIDELERALERKNRTILELSEERDSLLERVRPESEIEDLHVTIAELQTAITELEAQSASADDAERAIRAAVNEVHEVMPSLVPSNAAVLDLVSALEKLYSENERLAAVESRHARIGQEIQESGRGAQDPVSAVKALIDEAEHLKQELVNSERARDREIRKHTYDVGALRESQYEQLNALSISEEQLEQQLAASRAAQADLETKVAELESVIDNQHQLISDTRGANYNLVRQFFSELIEVMGAEFQAEVEAELQNVIEQAQSQGVSKLPMLSELLLLYTRKIAEEAMRSYTAPGVEIKVRAMEQEVQSLEHVLAMKLDKSGADAVLLAQNRDLRRTLKAEQEKRKVEWNEFTKTISSLR